MKKAAEKENVRRVIILNKEVYKALQTMAANNSLATTTFIRQLLTRYVNKPIVNTVPVKKKAPKEIPSTLKEVRPGRFEDSEGNQYVENSKGFMVAYDEDDDPDVVDI